MTRRSLPPLALLLALAAASPAFAADPPQGDAKIAEAERGLLILGLYHGKTTGLAGPEIGRAIESFQKQQNLPVTGRPDAATLAKIQEKLPIQSLNNPKTGAPERRASSGPAEPPRPQAAGAAVGVGGNQLPDAPREFNPLVGTPNNSAPPPRSSAASRAAGPVEAPTPLAAAPQEAVESSRVALPQGQSDSGFFVRAFDEIERGNSWLRWVWLPIAGLLVILGFLGWRSAGRSSNPYLARPGEAPTRRREPTLER